MNLKFIISLIATIATIGMQAQNVGIGTPNPVHALEVRADGSFSKAHILIHETSSDFTRIRMTNDASPNFWDLGAKTNTTLASSYMTFYYSPLGTNVVTMRGDGNVGIGAADPVHTLEIKTISTLQKAHIKLHENSTEFTRLRMGNNATSHIWDMSAKPATTTAASYMGFYYSGLNSNILTLRGDGNVGINAADPVHALQIVANSDFNRVQLNLHENQAEFARLRFTNTTTTNWWDFAGQPNTTTSTAYAALYYSALGRNVITFRGDGNVGIGNADPTHMMDLQGNSDFNKVHLRIHESDADFTRIRMTNSTGANFWDIASRPDINNNTAAMNFYYAGLGSNVLSLHGNGNAVLTGTLTQNSDSRLKKDIRPLTNASQMISQLSGYNYYWNDSNKDSELQIGLLAQEVQTILPHLVKEDDGGILSVNYSGLIPVLIEAVKEQQQRIAKLEKIIGQQ